MSLITRGELPPDFWQVFNMISSTEGTPDNGWQTVPATGDWRKFVANGRMLTLSINVTYSFTYHAPDGSTPFNANYTLSHSWKYKVAYDGYAGSPNYYTDDGFDVGSGFPRSVFAALDSESGNSSGDTVGSWSVRDSSGDTTSSGNITVDFSPLSIPLGQSPIGVANLAGAFLMNASLGAFFQTNDEGSPPPEANNFGLGDTSINIATSPYTAPTPVAGTTFNGAATTLLGGLTGSWSGPNGSTSDGSMEQEEFGYVEADYDITITAEWD